MKVKRKKLRLGTEEKARRGNYGERGKEKKRKKEIMVRKKGENSGWLLR